MSPARPAWRGVARLSAGLAFGLLAPAYRLLTDHEPWRRSCRALGALVPGPRVLDLGVGPGDGALEMAGAHPARLHVGLDRSPEMLARAAAAAARAGVPLALLLGDGLALPVRDAAFDGVTAHSYLYLVRDPQAALAEARRALRPGGRVALLEPRAGPLAREGLLACGKRGAASMLLWRTMSRLHRRFSEGELLALLGAAGLAEARAWPVLGGFGVVATAVRGAEDGAPEPASA